MVAGSLLPIFGIFWAELIQCLDNWEKSWPICIYLTLFAPVSFVVIYLGRGSWSFLAENMTKNIWAQLYGTLLTKHIGWFDAKENSAGQLTSILATEVQTLNGVSTESLGVAMEAGMGMIVGVGLGIYFCWPVALIAIGLCPLLMMSAVINAKV